MALQYKVKVQRIQEAEITVTASDSDTAEELVLEMLSDDEDQFKWQSKPIDPDVNIVDTDVIVPEPISAEELAREL